MQGGNRDYFWRYWYFFWRKEDPEIPRNQDRKYKEIQRFLERERERTSIHERNFKGNFTYRRYFYPRKEFKRPVIQSRFFDCPSILRSLKLFWRSFGLKKGFLRVVLHRRIYMSFYPEKFLRGQCGLFEIDVVLGAFIYKTHFQGLLSRGCFWKGILCTYGLFNGLPFIDRFLKSYRLQFMEVQRHMIFKKVYIHGRMF